MAKAKKVNVIEEKWDFLIILDACRYDYFEKIYIQHKGLFGGVLTKKVSIASTTTEWRDKSFQKFHKDLVFISSNPYINSVTSVEGFLASNFFLQSL